MNSKSIFIGTPSTPEGLALQALYDDVVSKGGDRPLTQGEFYSLVAALQHKLALVTGVNTLIGYGEDDLEYQARKGFVLGNVVLWLAAGVERADKAIQEDHADARRWRALLSSPRVRFVGGARLRDDYHDALLCVEFYDQWGLEPVSEDGKTELTKFADARISRREVR